MNIIKTAESVCEGHPDKLCDQISDAILDAALGADQNARVAVETMVTKGHVFVAGEMTCQKRLPLRQVIRRVLTACGYNPRAYKIHIHLQKQSADIQQGVDVALESRKSQDSQTLGAGDQGTMYGYATRESYDRLPLSLSYAHKLCQRLDTVRLLGAIEGIKSDGKAQVSIEYQDNQPVRVTAIVISVQHAEDKNLSQLKDEIIKLVIQPIIDPHLINEDTEILINPSGRFVLGGPEADTGLTGRKIMVDTYGGLAAHGGGAFSGKDPTKVDRSGAYMARHLAKQIVEDHLAEHCQVGLSYAIGKAQPVAVSVETFRTGEVADEELSNLIQQHYDLTPQGIIAYLNLRKIDYQRTACYGHFNSSRFPWEQVRPGKLRREMTNDEDANHDPRRP
ncbi:methionine adenosyltransferase [Eremococcus coleocola]|uniref:methionine adenosyltransferase n=1 Tax=Eremococcus coleocola TaxID=88132 RepID=UPI0003F58EB1|nr:methionine adenosyltransferase [Eremococcus coleocola]